MVENIDWCFLNGLNAGVEEKCSLFISKLTNAFSLAFPEKAYFTRGKDSEPTFEWFNSNLKKMREKLRFLRDLYKVIPTEEIGRSLRCFRSRYREAIKCARMNSNARLIATSTNPNRCIWEMINKHRGKRKKEADINITPDDFNSYFTNIAR